MKVGDLFLFQPGDGIDVPLTTVCFATKVDGDFIEYTSMTFDPKNGRLLSLDLGGACGISDTLPLRFAVPTGVGPDAAP